MAVPLMLKSNVLAVAPTLPAPVPLVPPEMVENAVLSTTLVAALAVSPCKPAPLMALALA